MIEVGFLILTRTPVPTLPRFIFFATICPNYAQWMTRYHLNILYSNETNPAACAMLEAGAMSITIL